MLNCECSIYVVIADMKDVNINKMQSRYGRSENSAFGQSLLEFKPLTLDSLVEIYPYLKTFRGLSCDYTAGGIFMWIDYFKYKYCIYEDTLFLKGESEENVTFSLPIGQLSLNVSVELLKTYCAEQGYKLMFSAITEEWVEALKGFAPQNVEYLPQWSDYVYLMESLATLKGKRLGKKRNHCNRFAVENPDATLVPVNESNIALVKECFEQVSVGVKESPMAQYELGQVWKVLDDLDKYPFEPMCLMSASKVVAFTIGEVIGDVLHVHVEKALREVAGASETINWRFAAYIHEKYPEVKWINRQDDAGDEGLRKAKQSYNPEMLLKKYNVFFE